MLGIHCFVRKKTFSMPNHLVKNVCDMQVFTRMTARARAHAHTHKQVHTHTHTLRR